MEFNKSTNCTECVHHTNEWLVQIKSKKIVPMHTIDYKSNLSFYSISREDKLLANGICSNSPIATTHSFLLSNFFSFLFYSFVKLKLLLPPSLCNWCAFMRVECAAQLYVYVCICERALIETSLHEMNFFIYSRWKIFSALKKMLRFFYFSSVRSDAILNNKFHFHSMSGYCKI